LNHPHKRANYCSFGPLRDGYASPRVLCGVKTITLEEHFVTLGFLKATGAYGGAHSPITALQPRLLDLNEERIAAMDEGGVDFQVLSLAAMGLDSLGAADATSVIADVNDELAGAVKANPTRLGGFAALALKDPESAARELERCVSKLGFVGALVDGTVDGLFLDDARFTPFWETAVRLKVPVYLHPALPPEIVRKAYYSGLAGDVAMLLSIAGWGWHAETGLHTLRLIVSGLFDRLPELQVVIGHMGEGLPYALARSSGILSGPAHLRQTVAEYFQTNLHVTTSGYFTQEPLKCAVDVIGLDRMMYSVDYPFSANTKGKKFLEDAAGWLSPADLEKLAGGNAARILKI
jgi:predicted TIM-barrel fold metal-dependent hydrolase